MVEKRGMGGNKQKILLVHNYYKIPGGEDTVVRNEKYLLEQHGHEVLLYTRSNQEMESFSVWQKLLLPFTTLFSLRTYREIKRLIKEEKPDIVHVHNTLSLISPSVYYAAFACRVPVVQTIHNFRLLCPAATLVRDKKICEDCLEQGLGCAIRHRCYRNSRLQTLVSVCVLKLHRMLGTYSRLFYIFLTDFNKEKFLQENAECRTHIKRERVYVKSNFVWTPQLDKIQKKKQYIYVGRLDALKGIHVLLKAWETITDKKLLICGSGPEEAWVKQYIKENQMIQVKMMGQLPHEEVLKLLAESTALVMPTQWYEGQPMVILESYAVGTPVLASSIGNSGSMVLPGKTGFCFKPDSPQALIGALEQLEKTKHWDIQTIYNQFYTSEKNYEILKHIYDEMGDYHERHRKKSS